MPQRLKAMSFLTEWPQRSLQTEEQISILFHKIPTWMLNILWDNHTITHTMYDFHNSTDTLKIWTEKRAINKTFLFLSDFDETWWSCSTHCVLRFHQVSSKSDEKQKSFIKGPFFCSEFQSVSRIVKIVHSAFHH